MDHPVTIETFTINEAAAALGRNQATFRRWIESDKMPAPCLRETTRSYLVYSVGELQVIAGAISEHERDYSYLVSQYTHVVEALHQAVHAYRAEHV